MTRTHRYDREPLRDPATGQIDPVELRRRLKGWAAVLVAFAVLFGGAGFVALKGYEAYTSMKTAKDFPGPGSGELQLVIPKNSTALQIGKLLQDGGVIKDAKKFQDTASMRPDLWGKVRAGKYKIVKGIPALTALQQLIDPTRAIRVMFQLKEAQRVDPLIINALAVGTKLPAADFKAQLAKQPSDLGFPKWVNVAPADKGLARYEGLLFPDTYEVPDGVKADEMIKSIAGNFTAVMTKTDFYNQAQTMDFGPQYAKASADQKAYLALVIASIIEREVYRADDRPKVARVIYNRLKIGMGLSLDSTVAYFRNKTGTIWTTPADRAVQSPYNTYLTPGLPPTPIAATAEAALTAAVNPADGAWLYFVPIDLDTGETAFTNTPAEHAAASAQLQAWCAASPEHKKKCA